MAAVMLGRPREAGIEPWLRWYGRHQHDHHEATTIPIKVTRVEEREGPPLLSLGRKPRFRYKPIAVGPGRDPVPRHDAGLACG